MKRLKTVAIRGIGLKLFLFLVLAWTPAYLSASENIRVAVLDNQNTVTVKAVSGLRREGAGIAGRPTAITFTPGNVGNGPIRLFGTDEFIQVNGKSYRGSIELRKQKNGLLLVVNDLDIEEYLKGVVASEVPHDWNFEALKAQAVASRTFALNEKKRSPGRSYHVLATVKGQVYDGKRGERNSAVRAVEETADTVLTYHDEVITAFYHSSCGGHTENAAELWGIDEPYLQGVECECQEISRYGVWEKIFTVSSLESALSARGYRVKSVTSAGINGITPAGRVRQVSISGGHGTLNLPGEKLRAAVGFSELPSLFFEVETSGSDVIFSGRGLGHGVGLCQWGAREMAERGFDYEVILAHYYPGTKLTKIKNLRR